MSAQTTPAIRIITPQGERLANIVLWFEPGWPVAGLAADVGMTPADVASLIAQGVLALSRLAGVSVDTAVKAVLDHLLAAQQQQGDES